MFKVELILLSSFLIVLCALPANCYQIKHWSFYSNKYSQLSNGTSISQIQCRTGDSELCKQTDINRIDCTIRVENRLSTGYSCFRSNFVHPIARRYKLILRCNGDQLTNETKSNQCFVEIALINSTNENYRISDTKSVNDREMVKDDAKRIEKVESSISTNNLNNLVFILLLSGLGLFFLITIPVIITLATGKCTCHFPTDCCLDFFHLRSNYIRT